MRIIVVEDEAPIRNGLKGLLNKMNPEWQVVGTGVNGREGLNLLLSEQPDVVLMDIRMPEMDGLEMLEEARKKGYSGQAVVISAYSDFEYARKAMTLGADYYVLKPVHMSELQSTMEQVEEKVRQAYPLEEVVTGEILLRGALRGEVPEVGSEEAMYTALHITKEERLYLFTVWMGRHYTAMESAVVKLLEEVVEHTAGLNGQVLSLEDKKQVTLVMWNLAKGKDWEAWFAEKVVPMIYSQVRERAIFTWNISAGYPALEDTDEEARQIRGWNLSLGNKRLFSERVLADVHSAPFHASAELHSQVRQAVVNREIEGFQKVIRQVRSEVIKNPTHPRSIRTAYMNLYWTALSTAREFSPDQQEEEIQSLLGKLLQAVAWEDMEEIMLQEFGILCGAETENEKRQQVQSHPIVRKANRLIEDGYSQGITLEEAARALNVTAEYLSRLYKKETGMTFTEAVRMTRLDKVKALLLGTGLPVASIANLTGFSDPKYMSRVFKEETGMTPLEYRSSNT